MYTSRVAVLLFVVVVAFATARRPNMVIMLTDEHNLRTLSCYREQLNDDQAFVWGEGVKVDTPNIDSLAKDGALFTSFYAAKPMCTPSRASFFSGRYPTEAIGAYTNSEALHENVTTFVEVLRDSYDYHTGYVGKWHLDGVEKPGINIEGRDFGFTDNTYRINRGHWKWIEEQDDEVNVFTWSKKNRFEGRMESNYITDFLFDRGIDFIQKHQEEDQDEPFALVISVPDPHSPDQVRPPYDTMFDDVVFDVPPTAVAAFKRNPSRPIYANKEHIKGQDVFNFSISDADEYIDALRNDAKRQRGLRAYFGMVALIDDNVGKLMNYLEKAGIDQETIVVFGSDHGDMMGEHGRSNKGMPYISSASMPLIMRYPQNIKPGKIIKSAFSTVDFFPTILNLVNASSDEYMDSELLAGTDLSQELTSEEDEYSANEIRFMIHRKWASAFTDRYKLVISTDGLTPWLFDLEVDPDELYNYAHDPTKTEVLHLLTERLLNELNQYNITIPENEYGILLNQTVCADSRDQLEGAPMNTCSDISKSDCHNQDLEEQCKVSCYSCCQDSPGFIYGGKDIGLMSCDDIDPDFHCASPSISNFCQISCGKCSASTNSDGSLNCVEYPDNLFVRKLKYKNDVVKRSSLASCQWLSKKSFKKKKKFCKRTQYKYLDYLDASSTCSVSCGTCEL